MQYLYEKMLEDEIKNRVFKSLSVGRGGWLGSVYNIQIK